MAGRYQAYQEYRKLDYPFLDKLPMSWKVKPLKVVSNFRQGKLHEPFIHEDGKYICVNSRFVSTEGQKYKFCTKNLSPVSHKDILMVMSDLPNGRALAKALYVAETNNYALNQRVCAVTATKVNSRFLYYQLNRNDYFLAFDDGCNQTNLSNDVFKNYPVLIPTEEEQQKIANFLDHETAKIDTLIAKQEKLIELLKEKRQAVISHAVTRGLNPDAPMKDSGVEWLGEVPEHWELKRLKFLIEDSMKNGVFKKKHEFGSGSKLVNVGDLFPKSYFISPDSLEEVQTTKSERKTYKVTKGDIFFVRSSLKLEGIGISACFNLEHKDTVFECHVVKATPNSELILPSFLIHTLNSKGCRGYFVKQSKTTTMTTIDQDKLSSVLIPVPPIEEQVKINDFIIDKLAKLDRCADQSEKSISYLKERKKALISAAVTGKIDVRNWQSND